MRQKQPLANRFRGYLPVVVDIESGGFDPSRHALLEIAAIILQMNAEGMLEIATTHHCHVAPFAAAELDPKALAFTGIDPHSPLRGALPEREALTQIFTPIRHAVKASGCKRAILVGHNAAFDLAFIHAAVHRSGIKRNPFHLFSTLDTVSLAGVALGQTVLARAVQCAGLEWDHRQAHSALYDAEKTAQLFCHLVNRWPRGGGSSEAETKPLPFEN